MADNVVVIKNVSPKIVPMYDMSGGQIGIVVEKPFVGVVVKSYNHGETQIRVFSLDSTNLAWDGVKNNHMGLKVEIVEPGSVVEIKVV